MKAVLKTSVAVAVLLLIIGAAKPFLLEIMNATFSQYEVLANEIVKTDENGNVELNGEAAEDLLDRMGEGAEDVLDNLTQNAEEILNTETEEVEGWREYVGAFFDELKDLISPLIGKEGN